jgi:hypothetical protein
MGVGPTVVRDTVWASREAGFVFAATSLPAQASLKGRPEPARCGTVTTPMTAPLDTAGMQVALSRPIRRHARGPMAVGRGHESAHLSAACPAGVCGNPSVKPGAESRLEQITATD